jgi:hypothetical protein
MHPTTDAGPVWLLDVDGVLNAAQPGWGDTPQHGDAYVAGIAYRLRWAPELIARVREMQHRGVEVRWATTWVDHIAQVERLMSLPAAPTAFTAVDVTDHPAGIARKLQAAIEVVENEGRPLIWTDDDAVPAHGPERERLEAAGVPLLLMRPHSRHGLQPADLEAIEEFLDEHLPVAPV